MKKINCDVVVVGAGPGGSMAAKTWLSLGWIRYCIERKESVEHSRSFGCLTARRIFE